MTICDNCIHRDICIDDGHYDEALSFCADRVEERPQGKRQRRGQNTANKELKSIKPDDYRRAFTRVVCGECKYANVPRNRKPCCSCSWLERESYYEDAENEGK